MLNKRKIGFIGAGNMGEAMIKGLLQSGASGPENVVVSDVRPDRLNFIQELFDVSVSQQNSDVIDQADLVVLAVKPQIMETVLEKGSSSDQGHAEYCSPCSGKRNGHLSRQTCVR
jgi:pyrroline-5-carboxylate reductase